MPRCLPLLVAAVMLIGAMSSTASATCWSDYLCCQGGKRMSCQSGAATGVFDDCGTGKICLASSGGTPECQPASVASYYGNYDKVS